MDNISSVTPQNVIRSGGLGGPSPLKECGNIESSRPVSPLRALHHRNSFSEGINTITGPSSYGSNNDTRYGGKLSPPPPSSPTANLPDTVKMSQLEEKASSKLIPESKPISILANKVDVRRNNYTPVSSLLFALNKGELICESSLLIL